MPLNESQQTELTAIEQEWRRLEQLELDLRQRTNAFVQPLKDARDFEALRACIGHVDCVSGAFIHDFLRQNDSPAKRG